LSLAIGRDGQNARLAAKLTGWRIDIKSLVEATSDAVQKLQTDSELAKLLPSVVETTPTIEQILTKKAEGRPVTPEEYTQMSQFVDRVERRTIQIQEEAAREEEERIVAARAEIPVTAFEMSIYDSGIKEHILNILTEAEFETVGDLMLALKVDADRILGLAGIGPKSMENIEESLAALTFPEPEPEPEPEAEPAAATDEIPTGEEVTEPEAVVEAPVEDEQEEPVPQMEAEAQPEAILEAVEAPAEEKVKEKKHKKEEEEISEDSDLVKDDVSLDELFALKEMFQTGRIDDEEEESSEDKKKGKKKKKKHVEIEYDEELGEVVARKKHKRGEDDFEENW